VADLGIDGRGLERGSGLARGCRGQSPPAPEA